VELEGNGACTRNAEMLVDESERHSLKEWVIPKLEKM
jgi:hypothetical protein